MAETKDIWYRMISVGTVEDMPPEVKNKIFITRGTSLFLAVLGPIFAALNFAQGLPALMLVNLLGMGLGLVCLLLLRQKLVRAAALFLLIGGGVLFCYSGLIYYNGMEYNLLLGMLGAVCMFESLTARLLLVIGNAAGFLLVEIAHFGTPIAAEFPLPRYIINVLVFLLGYYLVLEISRSVNRNYQRTIEQKNADLARSRRELSEEHAALEARTEELQVANQAKERLFSIVAHDLRGPIAGLKTSLELLESGDLSTEDFQEMVPDLKVGTDRAYECLDNLLIWSARQLREIKPIFTEVSLEEVARQSVELFQDTAALKEITIRQTIPLEARVWADETQVSSIVRNLISNALKFTEAQGSVQIFALKVNGLWRVTISDTGVGMTEQQVHDLLASSNERSAPGTENERGFGLGLKICHEFIRANHGTFSIESRPGHGSSFHFTLSSPPPRGEVPAARALASGAKIRVAGSAVT